MLKKTGPQLYAHFKVDRFPFSPFRHGHLDTDADHAVIDPEPPTETIIAEVLSPEQLAEENENSTKNYGVNNLLTTTQIDEIKKNQELVFKFPFDFFKPTNTREEKVIGFVRKVNVEKEGGSSESSSEGGSEGKSESNEDKRMKLHKTAVWAHYVKWEDILSQDVNWDALVGGNGNGGNGGPGFCGRIGAFFWHIFCSLPNILTGNLCYHCCGTKPVKEVRSKEVRSSESFLEKSLSVFSEKALSQVKVLLRLNFYCPS